MWTQRAPPGPRRWGLKAVGAEGGGGRRRRGCAAWARTCPPSNDLPLRHGHKDLPRLRSSPPAPQAAACLANVPKRRLPAPSQLPPPHPQPQPRPHWAQSGLAGHGRAWQGLAGHGRAAPPECGAPSEDRGQHCRTQEARGGKPQRCRDGRVYGGEMAAFKGVDGHVSHAARTRYSAAR